MKYNINKDFFICKFIKIPFNKFTISLSKIPLTILFALTPISKGVKIKKYFNNNIKTYVFEPKNNNDNLPCLIYFHGGGFGYKASPFHKKRVAIYAKYAKLKVIFPDYRLLPKYTYKEIRDDAINTYKWVIKNYEKLGINKEKIIIGGDSAGAILATYVTNVLDSICAQMLIYPGTDAMTKTKSMKKYYNTPMWNSKNNKKMWQMFLKGLNDSEKIDASPMQAILKNNIPNTYIEIAEFDPLHDEGINYYNRLKEKNTNVKLVKTKGTVHGYDMILKSKITKDSMQKRIEFLKENIK